MKTFRGALGDALRARRGNDMGVYNRAEFSREVAARGAWTPSTIEGYIKGLRRPTPEVMEVMASVLDLPDGAAYFREYRSWKVNELMRQNAEFTEAAYEVMMSLAAALKSADSGADHLSE